jgi:hypothetical protein
MTSKETIEKRLERLAQEIGPDETIINNVICRINESSISGPSIGPARNIWRVIMKSPITKLAAVAVIIISCMIGLSLWRSTGSGIALADALARYEQVKAFRSKGNMTINPGKPDGVEFRASSVMSREYGHKNTMEVREDPNGEWEPLGERYFYPQKKTVVQIGHPIKTYFRWEVDDSDAQDQLESLSQYVDPGKLLKDLMACNYENLGRSTIDGYDVEGFHTADPNYRSSFSRFVIMDPQVKVDVKIWVDVKTRLPVRYEERGSGLDEMEYPVVVESIMTDFEWDIPVTAAEFESPPLPDGYTVANARPGPTHEEVAKQGLRQCVELFGNYLESLSDDTKATEIIFSAFEKSETPAALRLKKEVKELTEDKKLDKIKSVGSPIRQLIWFYFRLIQDKKDPAYYGKTVTPKDAGKVLMRWKLSDNKYHVIFGDLHTETVSPDRLTNLENIERQSTAKVAPTSEQEPELTKSLPYADTARSLHYAARDDNLVLVKALVSKGTNVNAMDDRLAATPLHLAAYFGRHDVVRFLLSKGANVNARNKWNRTALDEAVDQNRGELAEVLRTHGAKLGSSLEAVSVEPAKSLLESAASKFVIPEKNLEIPEQVQSCAENLRKIYSAIKKYEKDKGTLPMWLSDLVPDYVSKEMLLCPHKPEETGGRRHDPRFPCGYGYEFRMDRRPAKAGMGLAGGMTLRDWKIEQVKLFGDVVPLIRCYSHGRRVNLAVSGKIYLSSTVWETMFIPRYYQEYQTELIKLVEKSSR